MKWEFNTEDYGRLGERDGARSVKKTWLFGLKGSFCFISFGLHWILTGTASSFNGQAAHMRGLAAGRLDQYLIYCRDRRNHSPDCER